MDNHNGLEVYSSPENRVNEHIQNPFEAANTRR
jgi:hypothetical protein